MTVTKAQGKLRLWRNTGLSSMTEGNQGFADLHIEVSLLGVL